MSKTADDAAIAALKRAAEGRRGDRGTSGVRSARTAAWLLFAIETGMTPVELAGVAWAAVTGLRFRGGGS